MSATKKFQGRAWLTLLLSAMVATLLNGCAAQTVIDSQGQTGPLKVSMKVDPVTLNPPQTGTITLGLTDAATDKPYTTLEKSSGALMHTVMITKDLLHFRHTYTQELVDSQASMYTYFPTFGTYMVYSLFKPKNQPVQLHRATITTAGRAGGDAKLVEEPSLRKTSGWLQFQLLKEGGTIKPGKPAQLGFYITERGRPVSALWPYLGAAGHLWIVDDKAENFAHIEGAAESRNLQQPGAGIDSGVVSATGTPGGTSDSTAGSNTSGGTGGSGAGGAGAGGTRSGSVGTPGMDPSPQAAPTLVAGLAGALSTVSAAPTQQLASVQETAQSSVLGTPEVLPTTAYGPLIAFTHTFPHAGLYKCWLEVYYRGQVVMVDYVLRVAE